MTMRGLACFAALMLIGAPALAQTAEQVFAQFEQAYQRNENFSADFEQTTFQQDTKTVAYGRLFFAKPNLLRMEYHDKDNPKRLQQLIVLDGKFAWSYTPVLNQVNKSPQTQQGSGSSVVPILGASFDAVRQHYQLALVEDEAAAKKGVYHLSLTARSGEGFEEIIEIWIRKKDWLPVQFSYQTRNHPAGDLTSVTALSHIKVNQKLPDDTFRFVIPEGAEVVTINP